uniref:Methyltransf_21 domain-containing protein n=1 Tax=Panagrellus redivivus TaxID=6233 RepID=A0A7E4UUD2_PANRE
MNHVVCVTPCGALWFHFGGVATIANPTLQDHPRCLNPDTRRTVGAKERIAGAYLMNRQGNDSDWYNMTYTSLQNIIIQAGMKEHVDLMLMDIEGAEFEILSHLIENPEMYSSICQLNVEIHSPWNNGIQKDNIVHTLFRLTDKREYMLYVAHGVQYKKQIFNRCFFINVKDPYCVDKYYPAFKNR